MNVDYLPYLFNQLSPGGEYEVKFEDDLFELFGTEDLSEKGLVGKWNAQLEDFEPARWNWGYSSLKGFTGMLYLLKCLEEKCDFDYSEFEEFYESKVKHQDDILQALRRKGLVGTPFIMIYTLKYGGYYFPALLLRIKKIEWNKDEHPTYPVYISFVPETYFVVDSELWNELDKQCRSKDYWIEHIQKKYGIDIAEGIEKIISSHTVSRNLYRLMPVSLLEEKLSLPREKDYDGLLYLKSVERRDKRREKELSFTDNQIFWGLFHHITNTKQQLYTPELEVDGKQFQIRNIPINTLSKRTDVFRQEAGVANALCHNLFDTFNKRYLDVEFGKQRTISAGETSVLRRAIKLREVSESPKEKFENTNFDYGVFLEPLGINHSILVSLTTALWEKGRGKSYTDYIRQSREMLFRTPLTTNDTTTIWFIAVDDTEKSWFSSRTSDTSVKEMVDRIVSKLPPVEYKLINKADFTAEDKQVVRSVQNYKSLAA